MDAPSGSLAGRRADRVEAERFWRASPVVVLPGYSRPMIRVEDYLELVERSTYRGDRVRPT
jgi:hypothetical protein